MSNGENSNYERAFKLFAQLMKLILDGRRSLEMVCAALQKIVFEERSWPKFKNWPEICQVEDSGMMMVLATLDLKKGGATSRQIVAAFPECFCFVDQDRPIPWMAFIQMAQDRGEEERNCQGLHPVFSDVCHLLDVPIDGFVFEADDASRLSLPSLPVDFPSDGIREWDLKTLISWRGKDFVVVDIDDDEVWIAPAERFDLNR